MLILTFSLLQGRQFTLSRCRQPYCSVENRIPRSTAALHSTSSVDSTGSDFGITPVNKEQRISALEQNCLPVRFSGVETDRM